MMTATTRISTSARSCKSNTMTDFDNIWRLQDEIKTVVNAVLGQCIWNLEYSRRRMAIELELSIHLDEETVSNLCSQFPMPCDYDGEGTRGTKFVFWL